MMADDIGEVIVEFVRNGAFLKCSAIHAATGTEAFAVGPVKERAHLERIAVAKLRRALSSQPSPEGRRGNPRTKARSSFVLARGMRMFVAYRFAP